MVDATTRAPSDRVAEAFDGALRGRPITGGRVSASYDYMSNVYLTWSERQHMHNGYFKLGATPFNRERMMGVLCDDVFDRLGLAERGPKAVLDVGCGVGSSMRHGAARHSEHTFRGVTISLD